MSSYKAAKEAFVSDTTGSSITHVNLVSFVALPSVFLYSSLPTAWLSRSLLVQWLTLALPLLLSITLFATHPVLLSLGLTLLALAFRCFPFRGRTQYSHSRGPSPLPSRAPSPTRISSANDPAANGDERVKMERVWVQPLPALTTYRAHMMLMTIHAILAVDFPAFPRMLAKCETFGVSLMDMGVGSFVFSQGIVSAIPLVRSPTTYLTTPLLPKLMKSLRKSIPVLLMGVVRLIMVKGSEYPEHESEYGTHWNFFFTLAFLPILTTLLHPLLARQPITLVGVLIAVSHQVALSVTPLQTYTLTATRTSLISQNKEGLVSLPGYLSLHILGLALGTLLLPSSPSAFSRQQKVVRRLLNKPRKYINVNMQDHMDRHHAKEDDDRLIAELRQAREEARARAKAESAAGVNVNGIGGDAYTPRTSMESASSVLTAADPPLSPPILSPGPAHGHGSSLPLSPPPTRGSNSFSPPPPPPPISPSLRPLTPLSPPLLQLSHSATSNAKITSKDNKDKRQDDKIATELCAYAAVYWALLGVVWLCGGVVSRRLANLPYVLWTAAFNTSFILGYLLLDMFVRPLVPRERRARGSSNAGEAKGGRNERPDSPELLEVVNKNGLLVFLVANVTTGLINLSLKTMYASDNTAMAVLSLYSFGLCVLAWGVRGKRLV
ncbi:hypothetical protein BD410DRAFT_761197 [Rickenella mellea]|uniref:GPI-anchored wall transfer protein 1 n=1 Tax=Rickenella mellea TaxID=50990 RepID=A0A4Y7QM04_9AGAM|nr:hypothetical protein BD410DRAFT_761197 [Rickenella mellea]